MAALEVAINALIHRYPIFRSTFNINDSGVLMQQVASWQELRLPYDDLRPSKGVPADEKVIEKSILEEIRRPFDLASGPPIRFRLLQRDEHAFVLVINAHHIVFDLVTKDLFAEELTKEYSKALSGQTEQDIDEITDYATFSLRQQDWLQSDEWKKIEESWKRYLDGIDPSLNLPVGQPAEERQIYPDAINPIPVRLPDEMLKQVYSFCDKENVTPFLIMLTAWALTLASSSGQTKLCVGVPMTNRRTDEFKQTMGCFVNILPMPFDISDNPTFHEAVRRVRMNILKMHRIQEMPYYNLVQLMRQEGIIGGNTLFQTGFTFEHPMRLHLEGLDVKPMYIHPGGAQLDLFATFWQEPDSVLGVIKYDDSRFNPSTVESIKENFLEIIDVICDRAEENVDAVITEPVKDIDQNLEAHKAESNVPDASLEIKASQEGEEPNITAISASFTAEVLQEFLEFWFERLGWRNEVRFAQFNQVFQELLNPSSLLRSNRRGNNIVIVRLDDLLDNGTEKISKDQKDFEARLSQVLDELLNAVKNAAQDMQIPLFFVLCPSSPDSEEIIRQESGKVETFLEELRSVPGVTVITHEEISKKYPIAEYYEPFGETIGRVPFTRPYLTALATAIVRSLHIMSLKPIKAIAVDCDWTLWGGVSAEDGATGVTIGPLQREFQQFLLDQYQAGVVLCLCSKNQEGDVWAVFDSHPGMLLRREHFTFWRINWEPKSSNIQSLAKEINIGLDAIAFLDDSPLERAEVSLACPSVFCVEFPEAWEERTKWLEHLWALDHGRMTAEDRKRQEHYRSEQIRKSIKKSAGSLQDFLEKLELKIDIHPADPADYERLGQLSVRTNQFNTTILRLTPQEVAEYAESPGLSAHIARVSDRFGDYGLVGGMLTKTVENILSVEGLFLSCRALGRGVEYRIAAYLASVAQKEGCSGVVFPVKTTERNEPARTFLSQVTRLCNGTVEDDGSVDVTVEQLSAIRYEPPQVHEEEKEENVPREVSVGSGDVASRDSDMYFSIASGLRSVDAILTAVEQRTREQQSRKVIQVVPGLAAQPETKTEQIIAGVWKQVLGLSAVNTHAKFFEVGGTSLLMVRIAVELKNNHGLEVTILDMFQYPTIADLAGHLDNKGTTVDTSVHVEKAAARQREALSTRNLAASFKRLKKSRG